MARRPELNAICAQHGTKMCSVEQIIEIRLALDCLVHRIDPVNGIAFATAMYAA